MDNNNPNLELEEFEEQEIPAEEKTREELIYELELKMQEIDTKIEFAEDELYFEESQITEEDIQALKQEYRELKAEKKALLKQHKTNWDKFPIWMFAYGVFQVVFSFFYVMSMISLLFASWFLNLINSYTRAWEIVSFFFLPFISIVASTIIFFTLKDKIKRRFFSIIFIIQGLETLITVILMIVTLVGLWK